MKRCMAALLILAVLAVFPWPAQAARETWQSKGGGTYTYEPQGDGSCTIRGWKGDVERLVIPNKIAGYPVSAISAMAFRDKKFKEVVVPDSVRQINSMAFAQCASLERATLPDALEALPKLLFAYCEALREVNIPSRCVEIGENAFAGCGQLAAVDLPEGLTAIGNSAFQGCASLEELRLPEGLTSIGNNGFFGCEGLKQLDLPEGLTELGWGAFQNCTGIRELTLPDSLSRVGYNPFAGMKLERLVVSPDHPYLDYADGVLYSKADHRLVGCAQPELLPARYEVREGTVYVEECAFYLCRNLESITLPDSVHTLYAFALAGCDHLTEVRLGAGLETLGSWTFRRCDALKEIVFPDSVKKLPGWVIDSCPNLERVVLPANVTLSANSISNCPRAVLVVARNSTAERQLRGSGIPYIYPDSTLPPAGDPQATSAAGEAAGGATTAAPSPRATSPAGIDLRDLTVDPDLATKFIFRCLILFVLAWFAWRLWRRDE